MRDPRRRKRKDQACEPCRKAKTRCDHTVPICLRCQRKGAAARCIYLSSDSNTRASTPHTSSLDGQINHRDGNDSVGNATTSPIATPAPPFVPSAAFFGPTSFSASFLEHGNDFVAEGEITGDAGSMLSPNSNLTTPTSVNVYPSDKQTLRLSLGVKILSQLPTQATCEELMETYTAKGIEYAFHQPTVLYCMKSFWATFGHNLKHPRKVEKLQDIAQLLTRNTSQSLEDAEDGRAWLSSMSGQRFRWEILGILFCVLGWVAAKLKSKEQETFLEIQSGNRNQRFGFILEMLECAEGCLSICSDLDVGNILMGEIVNAVTGLGFHHRPQQPNIPVSTTLEMKRRVFAAVFSNDKTLSNFAGRPPSLSHRYNACPLPLDLPDEILLADKHTLQEAAQKLDSDGWNVDMTISPASRIRAAVLYAMIMDEVLEISLGNDAQFSEARLLDIRRRNDEIQEKLPPWLRISNVKSSSNNMEWMQTALKFVGLQCSFLIEQAFVKRAKGDHQRLLDVARQLLAMTVSIWTAKDHFLSYFSDNDWVIMCYGIPSAGVICVELLNQMEAPHLPHSYLPRSEVIQNLSLLVGFLDWVRPNAPNAGLCGRMLQIVRRTLDKILDGPAPSSAPPRANNAVSTSTTDTEYGSMQLDDLDWLNTIDWTTGPFVDFSMDQ
ncbi:fungal specific transcription factor protein [Rutstroemia sp. NJR-2017a BVV2]|nr:fungal specific transcription factor protein [Rutstroemia sp. NJR-2017a BVV2]